MSITDSIELLSAYNGPLGLTLHTSASEALIDKVESIYGITLPDDFKEFYRFSDGFETDEDIFNMIPLEEIIDRKNQYNEPLNVAEYMIYCDMWQLEINPDDCNDYKIFNIDGDGEKLILTSSLAAFIKRFLDGGVFEERGLYNWHNEIKAQIAASTDTTGIVLNVFYEGLKCGIISIKEVINWADRIILIESEPEPFFIEMSLSSKINDLIGLLSRHLATPTHRIVHRALFGIVYQKLMAGEMDVQKASILFSSSMYRDFKLGIYEQKLVHELDDDFDSMGMSSDESNTDQGMLDKVIDFLEEYKAFNLNNYEQWPMINLTVQASLDQKYIKLQLEKMELEDEEKKIEKQQKAFKQKRLLYAFAGIFTIVALVDVAISYRKLTNNEVLTKFWSDLYTISLLFLTLIPCYFIIRIIYILLKKVIRT